MKKQFQRGTLDAKMKEILKNKKLWRIPSYPVLQKLTGVASKNAIYQSLVRLGYQKLSTNKLVQE